MQELIKGSMIVFMLRGIGILFGFVLNVMLGRLLGAEGSGVYFIALTIVTIASVIARLGLDTAVLRFASIAVADAAWETLAGVYKKSIIIALLSSSVATLLVYIMSDILAAYFIGQDGGGHVVAVMAFSIVPLTLMSVYGELLKTIKCYSFSTILLVAGVPMMSVILLFSLLPFASITVDQVAIVFLLAVCIILFLGFRVWRSKTPYIKSTKGSFDTKLLILTSVPLLWASAMQLVVAWTDILVLGLMQEAEDVGIYNVAARTSAVIGFFLVSINAVLAPKIAALYKSGDMKSLSLLVKQASFAATILSLPLFLVFVLYPDVVLRLFGEEFVLGAGVLIILAIGQLINAITGPVGYLLMMCGYERYMRNNITVMAIANLVLNIILIPEYGIVGAAASTAICISAMNLVSSIIVYKKIGMLVVPYPFGINFL